MVSYQCSTPGWFYSTGGLNQMTSAGCNATSSPPASTRAAPSIRDAYNGWSWIFLWPFPAADWLAHIWPFFFPWRIRFFSVPANGQTRAGQQDLV